MISDPDVVGILYLVSIICFILALRFLSSPKHARRGNWVGGVGMVIAIATTLALDGISNWLLIIFGAGLLQVLLTAPGGIAQQLPKDLANLGRLLARPFRRRPSAPEGSA